MDINRADLDAAFRLYESKFTAAYNNAHDGSQLPMIATIMKSSTNSVSHNWLEQFDVMREWLGDRTVRNVASRSFTQDHKLWERTIAMKRIDIDDDNMGHYDPIFTSAGAEAENYRIRETIAVMLANGNWGGDDTPAAFFGNTRTYGTSTIDNYSTVALSATEFQTAYQNMCSYTGHKGEPLEVTPTTLVFGPANRTVAHSILESQNIASNSAPILNPDAGIVKPLLSKRLVGTNANKWFLLGEIAGLKGIIWQDRDAAEIQPTPEEHYFNTDEYKFGIRARGSAVLAIPHLCHFGDVA